MHQNKNGYEPSLGYVASALQQIPLLQHQDMPEYIIKEYQPLLDSSNMTVHDWNRIAKDIADDYDHFDGFVVFMVLTPWLIRLLRYHLCWRI